MLEELQSLSETNKKRVLVIATTIIMVIIVGVWFSYFNSTIIGGTAEPPVTQATSSAVTTPSTPTTVTATTTPIVSAPTPVPAQASGPSLWQNIKKWFGGIANIFRKPSQYNIQPQ